VRRNVIMPSSMGKERSIIFIRGLLRVFSARYSPRVSLARIKHYESVDANQQCGIISVNHQRDAVALSVASLVEVELEPTCSFSATNSRMRTFCTLPLVVRGSSSIAM